MTGQQKVLLAVGVMILGIGGYIALIEGELVGVAVMGLATTMFALSAIAGGRAKKKAEEGDSE